jgi:Coenzyme PQQ synthesis protein D (PqqD)
VVRARQENLAWRGAGDEIVILDLAASSYHALNPSGALLWRRLADWATAGELTTLLASEFGLTPATAVADVTRFLDGCAGAGLLEARPTR